MADRIAFEFARAALRLAILMVAAAGLALVGRPAAPLLLLGSALAVAALSRVGPRPGTTHGSARFAGLLDLAARGMVLGATGLRMGSFVPARAVPATRLGTLFDGAVDARAACRAALAPSGPLAVRIADAVHCVVVAPPGKGKSRAVAMPILLDQIDAPAFVLDVKGELYRACAGHRARWRRQLLLDPFGATGAPTDALNPLTLVDPARHDALDLCRAYADAMVPLNPKDRDPHFAESARTMLAGIVATVVAHGERGGRHLQAAREVACDAAQIARLIDATRHTDAYGGLLRRLGGRLGQYRERELFSVLTTMGRALDFLDSLAIAQVVECDTFDLRDVVRGAADLYVVLPPEFLRSHAAWLRLVTTAMWMAQVRVGSARTPVTYLLDEIGNCGPLDAVEHALTVGRAFGCRINLFLQSVKQLDACFPGRSEVVLGCADTQLYFGVNDEPTARTVSARCGPTTVLASAWQRGGGASWVRSAGQPANDSCQTSWSRTATEAARPLLGPDEVLRLPDGVGLLFHRDAPPALVSLPHHDALSDLRGHRADGRAPGACGPGRALGAGLAALGAALGLAAAALFGKGF